MESPKEFAIRYREAFGDKTPMPIAFGYSNTARTEVRKIPRCMIGAVRKVCDGEALTLSKENVLCGGGSFYTGFAPMQERIPVFVSEVEHYKQAKEMVKEYVDELGVRLADKPYLNFACIDQLDSWDEVEGIICFANPDVLSGLCTWAFFDNNAADAVSVRFASGCGSIVTFARNESARGGRACFLGMLDPSARPLVPKDELAFTIPMSRLKEMMTTMADSALHQKAFSIVRKRICGEI